MIFTSRSTSAWAPTPVDSDEVAHGFNVADVARLARAASALARGGANIAPDDRVDIATFAITVALLEAISAPGAVDLVRVGGDAIHAESRAEGRHHGADERHPGEERPAFAAYWHRELATPWEETFIDRLAVRQIMPMLTTREQAVIRHLARYDRYPGSDVAAADFGSNQSTFTSNLHNARARFRGWWHEGETPSAMWGQDRAGDHGNVLAERRHTISRRAA